METEVIHKTGTVEDLKKDMEQCGFKPEQLSLETMMAITRAKLDNMMRQLLTESGLPLYLFDYIISSVQSDIRKADIDTMRMGGISPFANAEEVKEET